MGLFSGLSGSSGGGFFGSGGKTNSGNTKNDNRTTSNQTSQTVYGGDALSYSFGAMENSSINLTDHKAVNSSFELVKDMTDKTSAVIDNAFNFVAGGTQTLLDASLAQQTASEKVVDDSYTFAAGAAVHNAEQLDKNLDFVDRETDDLLEFSAGLVGAVLNQSNDLVGKAYDDIAGTKIFTAGLTQKVLDDSKESYERNLEAAQASHDQSLSFASGAFSSAVSNIRGMADKGFNFLMDSSEMVLGGIAQFTGDSIAQMQTNNTESLEAIKAASQTDSQTTNDMMFKTALGLIGVVGLGIAVVAWKNKQ